MNPDPPEPHPADMSPSAIDRRLRELAQLYKLGVELRSARRIGKVVPPELDRPDR